MDILWMAIAVDMMVYAVLGWLIAHFGRNRLPPPWNQAGVTSPLALAIGALITMVSFPRWLVYPS